MLGSTTAISSAAVVASPSAVGNVTAVASPTSGFMPTNIVPTVTSVVGGIKGTGSTSTGTGSTGTGSGSTSGTSQTGGLGSTAGTTTPGLPQTGNSDISFLRGLGILGFALIIVGYGMLRRMKRA